MIYFLELARLGWEEVRMAGEDPAAGEPEPGREAYRQRAWADAYEMLSAADRQSPLEPADLELLAAAAYLTGRDEVGERSVGARVPRWGGVGRPDVEQQSMMDGTETKGQHYYWKAEHLPGLTDGFLAASSPGR